jgi:hypothetical protein
MAWVIALCYEAQVRAQLSVVGPRNQNLISSLEAQAEKNQWRNVHLVIGLHLSQKADNKSPAISRKESLISAMSYSLASRVDQTD